MSEADEINFSGHVYQLDKGAKPQLCANCTHRSVCTLPARKPSQGCIYYDTETRYAVEEIINGFEDMLARSLSDLSTELGKYGLAIAETSIVQHEYVSFSARGNEINAQLFNVGITTKTKRVKS